MSDIVSLRSAPELCPHCDAYAQDDQIEYFRNGEFRWYSRRYECGYSIRITPGYIQMDAKDPGWAKNVMSICRKSEEYKQEQEKKQAEIDAVHEKINELDISGYWKDKLRQNLPKSTKMRKMPF